MSSIKILFFLGGLYFLMMDTQNSFCVGNLPLQIFKNGAMSRQWMLCAQLHQFSIKLRLVLSL